MKECVTNCLLPTKKDQDVRADPLTLLHALVVVAGHQARVCVCVCVCVMVMMNI